MGLIPTCYATFRVSVWFCLRLYQYYGKKRSPQGPVAERTTGSRYDAPRHSVLGFFYRAVSRQSVLFWGVDI